METSAATDAIVLAVARIAEDLISDCTPSEDAVFALATQIVATRAERERHAGRLVLEITTALLDHVPDGGIWAETRGRIWACRLFAWLLDRSPDADAAC